MWRLSPFCRAGGSAALAKVPTGLPLVDFATNSQLKIFYLELLLIRGNSSGTESSISLFREKLWT